MPSKQLDSRTEGDRHAVFHGVPRVDPTEARIVDLQQQLVSQVKTAATAFAETARLQEELKKVAVERDQIRGRLSRLRNQVEGLQAERDLLAAELDAIRGSETWRIGNAFVRPISRLLRRHSGVSKD